MSKLRLCVIFGGNSPEYEISLISAASVLENLNQDTYQISKIGITREGEWFLCDADPAAIRENRWQRSRCRHALISPDSKVHGIVAFDDQGYEQIPLDVVFPVLHGEHGEDGAIQGLLELAGIAYVGPGVRASAMCMDKLSTKVVLDHAGIAQADWTYVLKTAYLKDPQTALTRIEQRLPYPIFVKPAGTGSSVGVSKVKNRAELDEKIRYAFTFDSRVLLEETIVGKEVEVAVLGNEDPVASVCGEIVASTEFYDYQAKYLDNSAKLLIPAPLDETIASQVRSCACQAFTALSCRGLSRVDFFVTIPDQRVILNEVNTIPGFTSISMYPKLFVASGIPYAQLLDRLITLAKKA